eukprot:426409-Ditylum_brightwellii.AAC.1
MDTPKTSKALPIIKWTESFADFLSKKIGVRNIPLAYVIQKYVNAQHPIPNRLRDKPHTAMYGSVKVDLVALAPHDHPNYKEDNAMLYYLLAEGTQGTSYAASIKPKQRRKDGRSA